MNAPDNKPIPIGSAVLDQAQILRNRAVKKLRTMEDLELETLGIEDTKQLIHELRVHQIELEIQNEELQRAQEELEASRALFVDLYDFAPVGYVTVSEAGLILEANLTAAHQLGVGRSGLVMQPFTRFILPEDQDIYYHHRKVLFETGAQQTCELRLLRRDVLPLWVLLKATAAADGDKGQPVCRVILTDITERKQTEERLTIAYAELEVLVQERTTQFSVANAALSVELAEYKQAEKSPPQTKKK